MKYPKAEIVFWDTEYTKNQNFIAFIALLSCSGPWSHRLNGWKSQRYSNLIENLKREPDLMLIIDSHP